MSPTYAELLTMAEAALRAEHAAFDQWTAYLDAIADHGTMLCHLPHTMQVAARDAWELAVQLDAEANQDI